jgi:hypothetical protein
MRLKLDLSNPLYWFWVITLGFIISAVAGWATGYYIAMVISAIQVVFFLIRHQSLLAFPVQIRIIYFLWTLTGFWVAGRLLFYILLLLGTLMVVFFGRCSISMMLKPMPWNRNRVLQLY